MIMTEENEVMGNPDSLKDKLRAVNSEIDAIKNSFSKGAEDLARIQSMLDMGSFEEMSGTIERFETQVAEAEKQRTEAAEGAKRYSEELEKEKERLVKLWDAYKNQEEELSATEKKIAEYEERTKTAEASVKQMEEDYTARINTLTQKIEGNEDKWQEFDQYKQRCEEFDGIRNQLESEIHTLKEETTNRSQKINELNHKLTELEGQENYSEYKDKWEEVNAEYEKEKERLTKLYQLYEETDAKCKKLRGENKSWQEWYDSNKSIFEKLFSQGPPTPTETIEMPSEPVTANPENPIDDPTKKKGKKRKKLKFRK